MDYHTHSTHSRDGRSSMEDMCVSAIKKGVSEICFTEHVAVRQGDSCYKCLNMKNYGWDIERFRDLFKNKLIIRKGLEIGEPHLQKDKIQPFILNQEIDFIIGSVHNLGDEDLPVYIQGKGQFESYMAYFQEVFACVSEGDMDVIGHFDLLKRYAFDINGKYRHADYEDIIREILKCAITKNIGLEINTSGFRSSSMEIFPSQIILNTYKELGGEILTVGSDSHSSDMIGSNIASVYLMLKQIGFKYVYSFEKRKRKAEDI
ncbi:MAG: histidinol-phosphatase HisJ family protein [Eubacteriales bacterium]